MRAAPGSLPGLYAFLSGFGHREPASRYSYVHAHHLSRFQNLKNPSATHEADCRDLTSLCLRLCIGVKLRAASGPYRLRIHTTWAPPLLLCFVLCALSFVAFDESFLFMQIVEPLGNSVSKRTLRSGAWESLSLHDLCPCLCHCQAAAKGCVMGERGF